MNTKFKTLLFISMMMLSLVLAPASHAALSAVGPRDLPVPPGDGFPLWYQDSTGLSLGQCLDNNGFCLLLADEFFNPLLPVSFPGNFPAETFYYLAETVAGPLTYIAAVEGAFAGAGNPADGQQSVFSRVRFRANVDVIGTYTVTHPYGVETFNVTEIVTGPEINQTLDVFGVMPLSFNGPIDPSSPVGPFLESSSGRVTDPATGNIYLANPAALVSVTGSPFLTNFVRIVGPGLDATSTMFNLMGKVKASAVEPILGGISGTVKSDSGAGIGNVSVSVYDSLNMWVRGTSTDLNGNYNVGGLQADTYKVCFDAYMTDYLSECYDNQARMDLLNATPVSVFAGQTTDHIDAELTRGGIIAGVVKGESNAGIGNVWVTVYDTSGMPMPVRSAPTDSSGTYAISGLQSGTYKVCFDGSSSDYVKECYDDKPWSTWDAIVSADTVSVISGQTTILYDAVLAQGGSISGQVTSDGTTVIPNVWVNVCRYDNMTGWCNYTGSVSTGLNGSYTVGGLASGSYKVWFDTSMLIWSGSDYLSQWYDNKIDEATADTVAVTAPVATTVNAQLMQGGRISGTVTNGTTGIPGVWVRLYDSNGVPLPLMGMGATTGLDGTYSVGGLRTGGYKVCFDAGSTGYLSQCYNNKAFDPIIADTVSVTASQTTSDIDAVLVQGGTITGTVKNSGGAGIGNVRVGVYETSLLPIPMPMPMVTLIREAWTDPSGGYTVTGLQTGTYRVCFDGSYNNYTNECYNDKPWNSWNDIADADSVYVTAGDTTPDINGVLTQGGTITGRVTDGMSGLINVNVELYDAATGMWRGMVMTDWNGNYTIGALATGSYKVRFFSMMPGYLSEWYNDKADMGMADAVTVTAGQTTALSDAVLIQGGTIAGRVTDGVSGLTNVNVELYDAVTGMWRGMAMTDWNGNYTIGALATGSYKVRFFSIMPGYLSEWYNEKADMGTADVVPVIAGQTTTLNDAVLSQTGSFNVWTSSGPGGSISPASQYIQNGNIAQFMINPDPGYEVSFVGGCGGTWSGGNPYVTGPITADCMVTATFSLIPDTVPDAFAFTDQTDVILNAVVVSNVISVTGINAPTAISITGGDYSINGGGFTAETGTVNIGDTVTVRVTSSGSSLTTVTAVVTIGGVSGTFSVTTRAAYQFIGFLPPVANDGSAVFKSGRTVPVKFQLTDASGVFVTNAVATLRVLKVSDDILGTMDVDSSGNANNDTSFRYDPESSQYIYNLSSSGLGAGTFALRVELDDGSVHEVRVSLR